MRIRCRTQSLLPLSVVVLCLLVSLSLAGAIAHALDRRVLLPESQDAPSLFVRDEPDHEHGDEDMHSHSHSQPQETKAEPVPSSGHAHGHGKPLPEINETLILQWHIPTPPSYGTHDFDDPNVTSKHPGLMGLHALLMSLAFFVALPVGIALRSTRHPSHGIAIVVFYVLVVLGLSSSALYKKSMPDMYEGQKHSRHGYLVLLLAASLTIVDALAIIKRAVQYILAVRGGEEQFSVRTIWRNVILGQVDTNYSTIHPAGKFDTEYAGLVAEPEELDINEMKPVEAEQPTERWANHVHHHRQHGSEWRQSLASDGTLFHAGSTSRRGSDDSDDTMMDHNTTPTFISSRIGSKASLIRRIGSGTFAVLERLLVILGYMQAITGIVVYSGTCRDSYVNGCLAHLIKGGFFWCYGLLTFARFLGTFSEYGWAWNRTPARNANYVSAEFVESLVIFLYGITNTWMERFGIAPGTPFSTKEVQHISIAVMFWFAGLVGMGIESKTIRRWLAATTTARASAHDHSAEPPSYTASFNPFPALVIGVTGAAMSAHAQVYVFQVQIHSLWGSLLAASAVMRCLTYFFLWLGPPQSVMPSRPPTEALASFFLACGGLMFQFSTEEFTLAAMRRGHDDQMMFLNVAVAFTCLAFCWTLSIVALKGWLRTRRYARARSSSS